MILTFLNLRGNIIGTLMVRDGQAVGTGIGTDPESMEINEPGTLARLTPADGDRWLAAVRHHYRTPYVRTAVSI